MRDVRFNCTTLYMRIRECVQKAAPRRNVMPPDSNTRTFSFFIPHQLSLNVQYVQFDPFYVKCLHVRKMMNLPQKPSNCTNRAWPHDSDIVTGAKTCWHTTRIGVVWSMPRTQVKALRAERALFFPPPEPLRLPWVALAPDNDRLTWVYGQARATPAYRTAKAEARRLAQLWWGMPLLTDPIALHVKLWFPDKRRRDPGNYRKLLTDALTGVVYVDDALVLVEHIELAGYDPAAPRAELTIAPHDAPWFVLQKPAANRRKGPVKPRTVVKAAEISPQLAERLKRALNAKRR